MLHRQIDKLQKVVNDLLGFCAGDKTEAALEKVDLSPPDSQHEQLGIMLLKLQDGALEDRYLLRMEKWLLCDEAAMRYYVDFQSLTAMLHFHFNENKLGKMLDFTRTPHATA